MADGVLQNVSAKGPKRQQTARQPLFAEIEANKMLGNRFATTLDSAGTLESVKRSGLKLRFLL